MADKKSKRGLGRGLSALMADVVESPEVSSDQVKSADRTLPIESIEPNPDQPRRHFEKSAIEDLAASIREKGIIQPLIVRPSPRGRDRFEIVAGERRWRASQIAQLHNVPVIVREFEDTEVLEIAIIENIQRADLNPIEEAAGYNQLMEKFGHTQDRLSTALGKSRSHIANMVRLLTLPPEVQSFLGDGRLSAGHARALITAEDPIGLAKQVIQKGLSVRQTESLAKTGTSTENNQKKSKTSGSSLTKDADTIALENDLSASLGMKVSLTHKPGQDAGQLMVLYESFDHLDELCRRLSSTE